LEAVPNGSRLPPWRASDRIRLPCPLRKPRAGDASRSFASARCPWGASRAWAPALRETVPRKRRGTANESTNDRVHRRDVRRDCNVRRPRQGRPSGRGKGRRYDDQPGTQVALGRIEGRVALCPEGSVGVVHRGRVTGLGGGCSLLRRVLHAVHDGPRDAAHDKRREQAPDRDLTEARHDGTLIYKQHEMTMASSCTGSSCEENHICTCLQVSPFPPLAADV